MKSFTFCILLAHVLAFPLFAQKNAAAVTLNLAKAVTQSPKTVLMSELASDVRYFPLETTDNCLLGNECSIIYAGNSIIAGDAQTRSFYRFDKNGKFMNKIGRQGQGPEEYAVGLLFFTDPDNQKLYVQDFQDIICYGFNGKFLRRIPAPHLNMGTGAVDGQGSILYCDNNYFMRKDNPQQLFLIDENGKKLKIWKGYMEPGKKYGVNLSTRDVMYRYGGDTCLGKACYEKCKFKYDRSSADIRIGDLWGRMYKHNEDGVSAAVAFTQRGWELLHECNLEIVEHSFDVVAEGQMKEMPICDELYKRMKILLQRDDLDINQIYRQLLIALKYRKVMNRLKHPVRTMKNILKKIGK